MENRLSQKQKCMKRKRPKNYEGEFLYVVLIIARKLYIKPSPYLFSRYFNIWSKQSVANIRLKTLLFSRAFLSSRLRSVFDRGVPYTV